MLLYIAIFLVAVVVAVYATVIVFSHKPRAPFPTEDQYTTNDGTSEKYPLPARIDSSEKSTFKDTGIELSIVIPCYNETQRLGVMLDEAFEYLEAKYPNKYEILIVDDGSSDGTDKYAIKKANEFKLKPHVLRVIQLTQNRGKGGAVTHGLLHSRGRLMLFADADGATKFADIDNLIAFLDGLDKNEPGLAIGSRAHMVNTDAVVKRSFIRNFLMYGLHTLVYIFGIRDVKDTQCGFKMFNYNAVKNIFPHMHTERWIFDVEVLLLGEIQNMKLKELPVNWQEIDGSKVDLAHDSIEMAIDLVVTRIAYILGIYKLDECGKLNKKNV
ncbi:nucleotide-diphospho-sugar transferase [Scheffersomyces xylosifermentans]|uniref:nucleotide-diphospho-sugar transferase n=1 Tax=Scheffersomyces xylosifermentans TaxID=1304137 RepID=UPI00315D19C4